MQAVAEIGVVRVNRMYRMRAGHRNMMLVDAIPVVVQLHEFDWRLLGEEVPKETQMRMTGEGAGVERQGLKLDYPGMSCGPVEEAEVFLYPYSRKESPQRRVV